jgi:transposase
MWLRIALTEAAQAAARTKGTYLAAHHAQIRGRRGTQKAIGATRHDILVAYYHIIRDRVPYQGAYSQGMFSKVAAMDRARSRA